MSNISVPGEEFLKKIVFADILFRTDCEYISNSFYKPILSKILNIVGNMC